MRIEHDPKADTVYVHLRETTEFLNVSGGVDLADLPKQQELARALAARHIRIRS